MSQDTESSQLTGPAIVALSATQIVSKLAQTNGWKLCGDGPDIAIEKTIPFAGFLQTMAFVNAVAFVAERLNHHPEIVVQFNKCKVRFSTHDVQGISVRDFEGADQVDALLMRD